jgi:ATP-binding cassette, subfamily C, bacterial
VAEEELFDPRGLLAALERNYVAYVLIGLQPALSTLISGLGASGLRFVVTLARILDAGTVPALPAASPARAGGYAVTLRGVTFRYGPHAAPVLQELDLSVPEGDHLAVVGPSGIGKSTLASLVAGLLRPEAGQVALGGVPAAELEAGQLARLRVLIPQEAYVFTGTVGENLGYLHPGATAGQLRAAAEAVGAGALLDRLGGLAAALAPEQLSAGQRQLLALARAYVSPAPLVVLDEATCHLDPAAEERAERAFAARPGFTLIVVAHRISSALRADRVLLLDGPRARQGTHRELLRSAPGYRQLVEGWSDPARLPADADGVHPAAGLGLAGDRGQVVAHGAARQMQPPRDVGDRAALREE